MNPLPNLSNKTILLTGASRGIGAEIAKALATKGATVIGIARNAQALKHVGQSVQAAGGQWRGIAWDLADLTSLPQLVELIHDTPHPVDVLINNAGMEIYRAFADFQLSEIQATVTLNLLAAMELSRLLLPAMQAQGRGQIINIASLAAKKGHPYDSVYSASKAGLWAWSDALRQELYGTRIQVSVVCPGYISDVGMMADTGIPAPPLAGSSPPRAVAEAVLKLIQHPCPEVLVNKDPFTVFTTRLFLASWQLFPQWGDYLYRWIGVTATNQQRIRPPSLETLSTAPRSMITHV